MKRKKVESRWTEPILEITLNNPDHDNLLDTSTVSELIESVRKWRRLATVLVLKGRGHVFSYGRPRPGSDKSSDLQGQDAQFNEIKRDLSLIVELNKAIQDWKGISIACVRGGAYGAAAGLLAHCDVVIAERNAVFSFPEITYDVAPTVVSSYLSRALIPKTAFYLLLSGREISATTAQSWGLVSEIVPVGRLESRLRSVLRVIKRFDGRTILATKSALQKSVKISEPNASASGLKEFMGWYESKQ